MRKVYRIKAVKTQHYWVDHIAESKEEAEYKAQRTMTDMWCEGESSCEIVSCERIVEEFALELIA